MTHYYARRIFSAPDAAQHQKQHVGALDDTIRYDITWYVMTLTSSYRRRNQILDLSEPVSKFVYHATTALWVNK